MKTVKGIFVSLFYWVILSSILSKFNLTTDESIAGGAILAIFASLLTGIIQMLSDIYNKLHDKNIKK